MNFLQISKRVRQEVGASGEGPLSVKAQIGYSAKIVDWSNEAYHEVQRAIRTDWSPFNSMTEDDDEPGIDQRYHMAIVWRAVMFACAHDENGSLYQSAQANYIGIMNDMIRREMPGIGSAGPLA